MLITEVYFSHTLLDPFLTRDLYGLIFALRVVCRQVVVVTLYFSKVNSASRLERYADRNAFPKALTQIAIVPDKDYK